MGKYIVDQNSTVTSDVYIDARTQVRVVSDKCNLSQGIGLCDGNSAVSCKQKFASCNTSSKDVCTDQLGKIVANNEGKIPEGVVKESATWRKESWVVSNRIEFESLITNPKTGEKEIDFSKMIDCRIKYLLKLWTLGNDDPSLKLVFFTDATGIDSIKSEVMSSIGKVNRDIIYSIYRSGMDKLAEERVGEEAKN